MLIIYWAATTVGWRVRMPITRNCIIRNALRCEESRLKLLAQSQQLCTLAHARWRKDICQPPVRWNHKTFFNRMTDDCYQPRCGANNVNVLNVIIHVFRTIFWQTRSCRSRWRTIATLMTVRITECHVRSTKKSESPKDNWRWPSCYR